MAHDELDQTEFRQVPGGYDMVQVDDLLDRLRAAADEGAPLEPVVEGAGLELRGRGYDPVAVDALLDRLTGRPSAPDPVDGGAGPVDVSDLGRIDPDILTDTDVGRRRSPGARLVRLVVVVGAIAGALWLWTVHVAILEAVAERWGGTTDAGRAAAIWAVALPGLLGVGRAVVTAVFGGRRVPPPWHPAARALAASGALVLFASAVVAVATFASPLPPEGSVTAESGRRGYLEQYENAEIGEGVFDATGPVIVVGALTLAAAAGASVLAHEVVRRRASRRDRRRSTAHGPVS